LGTLLDTSINGDMIPKTFLQLKGKSVGNFNMACNFHISASLHVIVQYNLNILAIQEHTLWHKELSDGEGTSIEQHSDKWGYFLTISKLQILIIDKQLRACHQETIVFEEGQIIKCCFEVSKEIMPHLFLYMVSLTMVGKNYVLLTETLKRILHSENDRYSRTY
jgi:hypothetical protein